MKSWFTNYLSNRTQFTFANNIVSDTSFLTCGVPQNSVLGPTLFLIYINDVMNVLNMVNHKLYADDTALYYSFNNLSVLEENIQEDLNNFSRWCNQNALTVNVKKEICALWYYAKNQKCT